MHKDRDIRKFNAVAAGRASFTGHNYCLLHRDSFATSKWAHENGHSDKGRVKPICPVFACRINRKYMNYYGKWATV